MTFASHPQVANKVNFVWKFGPPLQIVWKKAAGVFRLLTLYVNYFAMRGPLLDIWNHFFLRFAEDEIVILDCRKNT